MGPFFKGQVYEWGRFPNNGSHTRTIITRKSPTLPAPPPPQTQGACFYFFYFSTVTCATLQSLLVMNIRGQFQPAHESCVISSFAVHFQKHLMKQNLTVDADYSVA